jgi:hypothetical protein
MSGPPPLEAAGHDERRRRWPARAVGLLLLAQGLFSLAIAYRQGSLVDWRSQLDDLFSNHFWDALAASGTYVVIAVLAFLASFGSILLRPSAWLLALFVQLLALVSTITFHFREGPAVTDALMAYSVFLVFYLKSRAVRAVLHGTHPEPLGDHG